MTRLPGFLVATTLAATGLLACAGGPAPHSPAGWAPDELERYTALQNQLGVPKPLAEASAGMVSGTSSALAVHAGTEVLRQGGSAVDAAIATALAQIALVAGSYVSYAGFTTMVFYDAETGRVETLNGGFNTIRGETDPLTIPVMGGEPSGRTALVPGFFGGLEAAHERYGRLPWARLFEPSIHIAEEGFVLNPFIAGFIRTKRGVLERLPETRRVFTDDDGDFYEAGDLFRQPELARTLRRVADEGADYIYRGAWARRFVELVRREGGKVTLEDLAAYEPIWAEPAHTTFLGHDVYTLPAPNFGGVNMIEALNLAETADLHSAGHFTESAESLDRLLRIANAAAMMGTYGGSGVPPERFTEALRSVGTDAEARLTKANAARLWDVLRRPGWLRATSSGGSHSDAVVAVDAEGNAVALLHTINTALWGSTGIFVDGISIPDAASFQQQLIARVGGGVRLPDPTNPLLVLKDGEPVLVSNSIGAGLHPATLQKLLNVFAWGMDPKQANDAPEFTNANTLVGPEWPAEVLATARERGHELNVLETAAGMPYGYWVAIAIDPDTGRLRGTAPKQFNGWAEGY